MCAKAYRN